MCHFCILRLCFLFTFNTARKTKFTMHIPIDDVFNTLYEI